MIKTNVIGTATLKATRFQALRNNSSVLADHHKADIKCGSTAWDQIYQNELDQNRRLTPSSVVRTWTSTSKTAPTRHRISR